MKTTRPSLVFLSVACLTGLVTCNPLLSTKKQVKDYEEGYEYVMITGSSIPQLVVKGQQPVIASQVEIMNAENARRVLENARSPRAPRRQ